MMEINYQVMVVVLAVDWKRVVMLYWIRMDQMIFSETAMTKNAMMETILQVMVVMPCVDQKINVVMG